MADQSIFGENQNSGTNPNQQGTPGGNPNALPNNDLGTILAGIKNERGEQKYKSVEDALKALQHSQEYIPNLKTELEKRDAELERLRQETAKINSLEQTLLELTQNKNSNTEQPPKGLSEEDIANLVSGQLTKLQQEAVQATNLNAVVETVKNKFGEKSEEVFYSKAKELGMSAAEINALAAKNPKAALKLLGLDDVAPNQSRNVPGAGSINTAGFTPPKDTAIGRNKNPVIVGATTEDLRLEAQNARNMVDELHAQGLSTYDLTDPKVFRKVFG